ncbi:MAG: hypothetical protein AAF736_08350 [Pseudomonadota bacterium]
MERLHPNTLDEISGGTGQQTVPVDGDKPGPDVYLIPGPTYPPLPFPEPPEFDENPDL